jgi:hypothetical protein
LTGCASLDALDRRLHEEFERARRYALAFSLVLLGVDGAGDQRAVRDGRGRPRLADLGMLFQQKSGDPIS